MAYPGAESANPVEHIHLDRLALRVRSLEDRLTALEALVHEHVGVDAPSGPEEDGCSLCASSSATTPRKP